MHHNWPCVSWFPFRYHLLSPTTTQLPALGPSTIVDVIQLYLPAIGSSDTYPIPPGVLVLSNMQIYMEESTTTIDFIEPDWRPLISISHRTLACTYPSRIFIKWTRYKPSISISPLYTVGSRENSSLTYPLSYFYTILFNQSLTRNHYFLFTMVSSILC